MSADTNVNLAKRLAAVALALVGGGCASGAWRSVGQSLHEDVPDPLPAHRAVERVTLRLRGHEFEFVGYRTCDPATGDVRAQLLLDSGISVLDVSVHGAEGRRISGSAFEAIPDFAKIAMEDLRRTWGSRSVFVASLGLDRTMFGGIEIVGGRVVTDGRREYPSLDVEDGSVLAFIDFAHGGSDRHFHFTVTLLDAKLVPEATIAYSDFDDDGVPREIHLVDLRDHHTLDVEVEEVHLVAKPAEPAK